MTLRVKRFASRSVSVFSVPLCLCVYQNFLLGLGRIWAIKKVVVVYLSARNCRLMGNSMRARAHARLISIIPLGTYRGLSFVEAHYHVED